MRTVHAAALAAVIALGCAPALSACSTLGVGPVSHQAAEKALIDCDTAYVAIVTVVNVLPADKAALGADIKAKAWQALLVARSLYAANQSPNLATLAGLLAQAQALKGA